MTFRTEVVGCYWNQDKGEWLVKLKETKADGSTRVFEDTCNLLLHGTGILNNFKWPAIEGMEKFKGKVRAKRILAPTEIADWSRLFTQPGGQRTIRPSSGKMIASQ